MASLKARKEQASTRRPCPEGRRRQPPPQANTNSGAEKIGAHEQGAWKEMDSALVLSQQLAPKGPVVLGNSWLTWPAFGIALAQPTHKVDGAVQRSSGSKAPRNDAESPQVISKELRGLNLTQGTAAALEMSSRTFAAVGCICESVLPLWASTPYPEPCNSETQKPQTANRKTNPRTAKPRNPTSTVMELKL